MLPFTQLQLQLFVPRVEAAGGHPVWMNKQKLGDISGNAEASLKGFPLVIALFYITFLWVRLHLDIHKKI